MTLQQWFDKVGGKYIDYDGVYGAQCVDLVKSYFADVIGIPAIRNNAVDYWTNYPTAHFTKIVNTPSFVPQRGDIMIWGTAVGQYGHIAIVVDGNVNTFRSLDQNWPFSNGTTPSKVITHNYTGVLGVLRPKKDVNFDQAAYEAAERARKEAEEIARRAKEEADRKAAEEVARLAREEAERLAKEKAEADRIQKEEAARVAAEQKKLAEEQAKLQKELEEKLKEEKPMSPKFSLNKQDLIKVGKGALLALAGALGAYLLTLNGAVDAGVYTPFVAGALSVLANLLVKFSKGE